VTPWEKYKAELKAKEKTPWQKYKEQLKQANPLDLIDTNNHAEKDVIEQRYKTCLECPELIQLTKQCKQCGCFMGLKTKLKGATCPLGKW
jgi:hypothetical protein